MKGWECSNCKAEIRGEKPEHCPICNRRNFSEIELPEKKEDEGSKKIKEAMKQLEKYDEGVPPTKLEGCCGTCGKH